MKKLLLFGLGVIASLSTLTSCKKEEVAIASPTITFLNGVKDYPAKVSDTAYTFVADVEAAGEISSIKIFEVATDGSESQKESVAKFDSDTKHSVKYTVNLASVVTSKKFKITVTDKKDVTTSAVFTITAYTKPAGAISTFTAKLLGAQYSATGSFLSTSDGTIYTGLTGTANQAAIDLAYYFSGDGTVGNGATIGALDDINISDAHSSTGDFSKWTKNATRFSESNITPSEFDALTDDSKFNITSFPDTKETLLKEGEVIAFKTVKGKLGYIKITALKQGLNTKTNKQDYQFGTIEIVVKVQK